MTHEFNIQRIYIKNLSYETPHTPDIFQEEWLPQVDLDMHTSYKELSNDSYEVTLQITSTVKLKEKTAFLIEVEQAGIFIMKGFDNDQLNAMLGSFCPNILFPYAREIISSAVSKGSFPPLYLSPVNFDAIYQEKLHTK